MSEEQNRILKQQLWNIANELRGNMGADEFRDYILGFIFYKYLSEKIQRFADAELAQQNLKFADLQENTVDGQSYIAALEEASVEELGYFLKPSETFHAIAIKGSNQLDTNGAGDSHNFILGDLTKILKNIEQSTLGTDSADDLVNLFEDLDLTSSKLGRTEKDKNDLVARVLVHLDKIDFNLDDATADVLGDAYEYLIGEFASGAGKKAGEFYTPQPVSTLLAKLVTANKQNLKNVYDPTCGSGSLLLRVKREAGHVDKIYGQELNRTTYNLARMNMILHDVHYSDFDIKQEDTLERPQHRELRFDAIVANPPFSANWSASQLHMNDDRFSIYGKLAPSSKADMAFVQHMIYHLSEEGTMAVVLPHGVLFRGAAEGHIRQYLIEQMNCLDAVIGLPANIFYGTSIPTCVLVLKKCRKNPQDILFIDASKHFDKVKTTNVMRPEHIQKIVDTYKIRTNEDKYSHVATLGSIKANDYNLNIPRYVDTFEAEDAIDLGAIFRDVLMKNPTNLSNSDFKRLLSFAYGKKEQLHPNYPLIFPYNEHLSGIPLYFVSAGKYLSAHIKSRPIYDLLSGYNIINLDSHNMGLLADYYVQLLIKLNPLGPYLLGGYCSGALLAFEIAKRLLNLQKSVPLLIMVDQSLPYRYSGRLAFLPFKANSLIDELSRVENTKIIEDLYPCGWSLDIIQSEHYPELYYMSAMIVAERIDVRIQESLVCKERKALANSAKQFHIETQLQQQSFEKIVFNISISNNSNISWPAGQICITYHWLSNLGRLILWAENKVTINDAINPGEKYKLAYEVEKLRESGEALLVFSLIDNFGTWFKDSVTMTINRKITSYNAAPLDLNSINNLQLQSHLTQAIQEYNHYLSCHQEDASEIVIKLAKAVRLARGAKQANDIYEQALIQHIYSIEQKIEIYQDLARNYASFGDFEKSVFYAKKVLQVNHKDYLSLSFIGLSHAHKKNHSTASTIFKKIIRELNGNYSEDIIFNMNKFIELINDGSKNSNYISTFCKKLIKHNPYNPVNYYILGANLLANEKYKEAEEALLSCIQVYPYVSPGYEMLHHIYIQQKQFSKAIAMKYRLCELKPFCIEQHNQLIQLQEQTFGSS